MERPQGSEYNEMKVDVKSEFEKYGNVVNMYVVSRRSNVKIGAEIGSIFIEFDDDFSASLPYIIVICQLPFSC